MVQLIKVATRMRHNNNNLGGKKAERPCLLKGRAFQEHVWSMVRRSPMHGVFSVVGDTGDAVLCGSRESKMTVTPLSEPILAGRRSIVTPSTKRPDWPVSLTTLVFNALGGGVPLGRSS